MIDVAIVGGGPAGLALAAAAAKKGLEVVVFEKKSGAPDKACGEGLMPFGLHALETLGARRHLSMSDTAPIESIEYVQEDGSHVTGKLPGGGGLGIRRIALTAALEACARESGALVHHDVAVRHHTHAADHVALATDHGPVTARVLVAADGLASPRRHQEGLDGPPLARKRFGLRQHFALAPWSRSVEVHWSKGVEAYVTPAGAGRVGVAFLWEDGAQRDVTITAFRKRFPRLDARLGDAPTDSAPRGAGPLARGATARVRDRFVLLGDAAGYVDAITGEGLSLAFACAVALGDLLPVAIAQGANELALAPYERAYARVYGKYARLATTVLAIARAPRLRRAAVHTLARFPKLFDATLGYALG